MVHLVTERPREALLPIFVRQVRRCFLGHGYTFITTVSTTGRAKYYLKAWPVIYELIYLATSVLFLIGSVCFLPEFGMSALDTGCNLFILGSVNLFLLMGFDFLGDVLIACGYCVGSGINGSMASPQSTALGDMDPEERDRDGMDRQEDWDEGGEAFGQKLLYMLGSLIFAWGTFYWQHPRSVAAKLREDQEDVMLWAAALFVIGSCLFVFAAFLNALSLAATQLTFTKWAIVTCSVYELGGIMYVVGSAALVPNKGCAEDAELIGAWCFILGSLCYIMGNTVEFMKTVALLHLKQQEEEAAASIGRAWRRYQTTGVSRGLRPEGQDQRGVTAMGAIISMFGASTPSASQAGRRAPGFGCDFLADDDGAHDLTGLDEEVGPGTPLVPLQRQVSPLGGPRFASEGNHHRGDWRGDCRGGLASAAGDLDAGQPRLRRTSASQTEPVGGGGDAVKGWSRHASAGTAVARGARPGRELDGSALRASSDPLQSRRRPPRGAGLLATFVDAMRRGPPLRPLDPDEDDDTDAPGEPGHPRSPRPERGEAIILWGPTAGQQRGAASHEGDPSADGASSHRAGSGSERHSEREPVVSRE